MKMKVNWTLCSRKNIFHVIKGFRVEPIAFLNFVALGIFMLINQVGIYQAVCYHTIGDDPRFNCSQLGVAHGADGEPHHTPINHGHSKGGPMSHGNTSHHPMPDEHSIYGELETKVQQAAVTWHLIFQLAHSIPALFADAILGALGDRHGRKVNILIGLMGMIISVYPLTIIFTYKNAPLFILVITNLISGFTGFMSIIMISCFAYLADTIVDPEMLTIRMTYFSVIMSLSGIFSPLIGNAMLSVLSYAQSALVCECIQVFSFFLALIIIQQRPPLLMRKKMLEKYVKRHGHPPPLTNYKNQKFHKGIEMENFEKCKDKVNSTTVADASSSKSPVTVQKRKNVFSEIISVIKQTFILLKEVYHTYTKPRPGHARLYLLFAALVYFLNVAFEGGLRSNVFGLYVQKSPFNWGASEISKFRSINSALHLVGSLVGAVLFKKVLKISDTSIILIAMGTHSIECVILAFANSSTLLYLSAATGLLAHMFQPCIKSFTSQLVEPDEVGKSFTAFGLATNIAFLTSSVLYSSVYRATVGWFPGFAFLLAAGLQILCMCMFFWLHLDYHYDGSIMKCLKQGLCCRPIKEAGKANGASYGTTKQIPVGEGNEGKPENGSSGVNGS